MKKTNLIKRMLCCALALVLCFTMAGVNVFAAEVQEPETVGQNASIDIPTPTGVGDVLTAGMSSFTESTTVTLTLHKANWNADFVAGVVGNAGARYEVILTDPDGVQYTEIVPGGTNNLSLIVTMVYAKAGTYKFKFTRLSGASTSVTALAEIHD